MATARPFGLFSKTDPIQKYIDEVINSITAKFKQRVHEFVPNSALKIENIDTLNKLLVSIIEDNFKAEQFVEVGKKIWAALVIQLAHGVLNLPNIDAYKPDNGIKA